MGAIPAVSVIVPAFNVADHLPGSLASLAAQTCTDLEILVVDDASTDATVAVAEAAARSDRRIRVVKRERNGGISAARNSGLDLARGEFVAFLDADDDLPVDALAVMVATLRESGSDLVTGSFERVLPDRRRVLPRVAANHRLRRLSITLSDQPLLLADVFAWNKLYRAGLWREHRFPEGLRYEDQAGLTPVWLAVDRIDVIPEIVYHWNARAGSQSERRWEMADLVDRIQTKRDVLAAVRVCRPDLVDLVLDDVLVNDIAIYFRTAVSDQVPVEASYWPTLVAGVRELWADKPIWTTRLTPRQRLMGWLVWSDRREDLAKLIRLIDAPGQSLSDPNPWADDPDLPAELRSVDLTGRRE